MKKRAVELVVGAILLMAVMLGGCGASAMAKYGRTLDASASLLNVVCVEDSPKCAEATALLAVAMSAYRRAETAEAAGTPDAAELIDQAAKAIEDLLKVLKGL
jgi:hypothetical protein